VRVNLQTVGGNAAGCLSSRGKKGKPSWPPFDIDAFIPGEDVLQKEHRERLLGEADR